MTSKRGKKARVRGRAGEPEDGSAVAATAGETAAPGEASQQEVVSEGRQQVALLLKGLRRNPNGDAAKMVEILLLNQVVNQQQQVEDLIRFYGEQSKRITAEAKCKEAEWKLTKAQKVVDEELKKAQAATQGGRPLDSAEICRRISAAIGITGIPEERIEAEETEEEGSTGSASPSD